MDRRQTVLVIDPEPEVREALQLALEDEGYTVQTASDTTTGLSALRSSSDAMVVLFDVVPFHHLTRAETGLGLLDAVGQDAARLGHHAFVMLTTAPAQAVTLAGALPPRLTIPVVRKPFELDALVDTIEQAAYGLAAHRICCEAS